MIGGAGAELINIPAILSLLYTHLKYIVKYIILH